MHLASRSSEPPEPWETETIEREARAYFSRHSFRWSDEEDLRSEATMRWLNRRSSYDARRASRATFLKAVARSAFADLLRAELTHERRGHRAALSTDAPISDKSDLTLGDGISDLRSDPAATVGTLLDTREAFRRLSPRQRSVLADRAAGYTMTEIASRLGVHRATVDRELHRIRAVFRDAGLG
jgi:RNA polymerase sigma factor (sigma-70 family)